MLSSILKRLFHLNICIAFLISLPCDLASLQKVWHLIADSRKITLLEDLEAISDSDTLTSFFDVGRLALKDRFPPVRELGIRLLWECEEHSLVKVFLEYAQ